MWIVFWGFMVCDSLWCFGGFLHGWWFSVFGGFPGLLGFCAILVIFLPFGV